MSRGALFLLATGLVGCEAAQDAAPETAVSSRRASAATAEVAAEDAAPDRSVSRARAGARTERMVIRSATLRLRTGTPQRLVGEATRIASDAGGFVVTSGTRSVSESVTEVSVQLRVEAAHFHRVLERLREIGRVMEEQIRGEDVTEEYVDVEARIRNLRQLETRYLALADGSGAVEELLEVERELARVRGEVERLQGRALLLLDQSRLSTIDVVARSPEQPGVVASQSFGSRLGNAFARGWHGCVAVLDAVIVVTVGSLPLTLLAVLLVAPFWLQRRRRLSSDAS